jgi:hypothetical protein
MKKLMVPIVDFNRSMRASVLIALVVLTLSACAEPTPAAIGERLDMGPFTFSVVSATQGKHWESAEGPYREIVVRIRVHRDDTAPYTETFSSSFIDSIRIVDAAGNSIGTSPAAVAPVHTAGRYRSAHYTCLFRYSRSSDGVRDFDKIGTRPQDFKLLVTNPAPEGQQPRRVAIEL